MSAAWQLDGTTARLFGAQAGATIDLAQPAGGLVVSIPGVAWNDSALRILGIEVGNEITLSGARLDAYIRGADLVATFDEGAAGPITDAMLLADRRTAQHCAGTRRGSNCRLRFDSFGQHEPIG